MGQALFYISLDYIVVISPSMEEKKEQTNVFYNLGTEHARQV